jgi:2-polyprenyl-6-methoxyphenol hydroxylase-like FAD-dependent oxidoreductase
MPQVQFLEFVIHEAGRFPSFRLVMGARVNELVENNGTVVGVRYRGTGGLHEIRALLTVGADGRYSMLRKLGGFQAVKAAPPLDLLWFRLPREPTDPHGLMGRFGNGHVLIQLDRGKEWQCGYSIPKGAFPQIHSAGIEALRQDIISTAPEFADRMAILQDWKQISLLSVEADYLQQWYKAGLLLIGDAAHVMSPVGGNGINFAIQDAVAAANILRISLKEMNVTVDDLAKVQRRRERAVKTMQMAINVLHRILPTALAANKRIYESSPGRSSFSKSAFTGMMSLARPFVNAIFIPAIAFGISPVHVEANHLPDDLKAQP